MGGQGPAGSVLLIEADQEHEDEPLGQREPAPPPPRRGLALEPVTHSGGGSAGKALRWDYGSAAPVFTGREVLLAVPRVPYTNIAKELLIFAFNASFSLHDWVSHLD